MTLFLLPILLFGCREATGEPVATFSKYRHAEAALCKPALLTDRETFHHGHCEKIEGAVHFGMPDLYYMVHPASCVDNGHGDDIEQHLNTSGATNHSNTSEEQTNSSNSSESMSTSSNSTGGAVSTLPQHSPGHSRRLASSSPSKSTDDKPVTTFFVQLQQFYDKNCTQPTGFVINATKCAPFLVYEKSIIWDYKFDCGESTSSYARSRNNFPSTLFVLSAMYILVLGK